MRRDRVLQLLREHRDALRQMGVASLSLFGSVARDEARDDSDVVLLVEFDRPMSLFPFIATQQRIEEILGVAHVDLVMREALRKELKDEVFREAVRAT